VGIDGSKALRRAVVDVFDHPVIQRCQLHKTRNVQDRLPQKLRSVVAKRMRAAYHADTALAAQAQLESLAGELNRTHPGAAASLREGLEDMGPTLRLARGVAVSDPGQVPTRDPAAAGGCSNSVLRAALEVAVRAPSLHNSQPWLWRVGEQVAQLYLDQARRLPASDPYGRELVISCGAALHHLVVALASRGYACRVKRLPDPADSAYLARVELAAQPGPPADTDLAEAIARRRTERRRLTSWPVPPELIGELSECAELHGLTLRAITDPAQRWSLYRAISEAARRQAADPAYVAELESWTGRGPGAPDGVPAASAPPPGRIAGQPPMRHFAHPELAQPPNHGEPEGAALLVLSSPTDSPLQWLRAGEVTSAILLAATRDGLASTPLTQPLEIPETRELLRTQVSAGVYPQILLRLGWLPPDTAQLPPTPRRGVAEVIRPIDDWRGL
jgi:nitroreductase